MQEFQAGRYVGHRYWISEELSNAFWSTMPQPTGLCALSLSEYRQAILHGQMLTLPGSQADDDDIELVELLRGELATEHAEHLK